MNGDRGLIAMRRAGHKPGFVWVSDFPGVTLDGVTVCVAGDTPELLDLRFLVGTTAIVEGPDRTRVDRIANACGGHARRVITNTFAGLEVVRITDSQGTLKWPK